MLSGEWVTCAGISTGLADQAIDASVSFYPNPANQHITLRTSALAVGGSIRFFDPTGREVLRTSLTLQVTVVNLEAVRSSFLFARVLDAKGTVIGTERLVLMR